MKEDAPVGTAVLQLAAVDPDGPTLDYFITGGDPSRQFAVRASGLLYLTKALDREVMGGYELLLSVTDSKYVAHATVVVDVIDVNGEYV